MALPYQKPILREIGTMRMDVVQNKTSGVSDSGMNNKKTTI